MFEKTRLRRRSFLGSVGAYGAVGMVGGIGPHVGAIAAPLENLTIVNPEGSFTLVFQEILKEGTYFSDFGAHPKTVNVSDGAKVLAALVGGGGDLCAGGGFSSLFPAIERGAKIKILAGALLSPVTCIYTTHPEIKATQDLIGRTVGTGAPGALLHELVVGLLIKRNVDYKKVKFVNVGSSLDVFKAIVAGTVDAGISEVDFYDQQQKYGVHTLSDGNLWDELPEYTDQAFFAPDRAIAENRDALVRALAAHAKMFRYVTSPQSHDTWFKARAAAFGKNDVAEAETQWKFLQGENRLATHLVLDEQNMTYVQNLNVLLGVQKKVLPFELVADMSLARDALKLLAHNQKSR